MRSLEEDRRTILREIAFACERPIGEKERAFEERSRSILSGVSAFLEGDLWTDGIWKISIRVNSSNALQHMKTVGGVLRFNIEFDLEKFLDLAIEKQKNEMMRLVTETLLNVFTQANLDANRLEGLREFIVGREFKSTFTSSPSVRNGIDACVVCVQNFERTNVFISLKIGAQEIERIFVLATSPEEYIFNVYLKPPEWASEVELRLVASNGEIYTVRRPNRASE